MMLPSNLNHHSEWVILGPMGPEIPASLASHPVIAVDGGAHFAKEPLIWVGDEDSFSGEITATHVFRHPPVKDHSDLALALSLLKERIHYRLHFWGFLGGRRDHEVFNFGEAMRFLEEHPECEIRFYTHEGAVLFHGLGSGHWKFSHSGLFSLGTLKKTTVKLTGACDYPMPERQVMEPLSSLGLSNFARGDIHLEAAGPVFLIFPEAK